MVQAAELVSALQRRVGVAWKPVKMLMTHRSPTHGSEIHRKDSKLQIPSLSSITAQTSACLTFTGLEG